MRPLAAALARPLSPDEIDALDALLAAIPAPLQPLDASALDGFLCGVLVQPEPVPERRWWPHVLDVDGRPAPAAPTAAPLHALVVRRHAELAGYIARRDWFDPWVFAAGDADRDAAAGTDMSADADIDADENADAGGSADADENADAHESADAAAPWAGGFALALETFPELLAQDDEATTEALALIYCHLDTGHLEEAEALLEAIAALEPAQTLDAAVQDLVRATMLLADAAGLPAQRPVGRNGPGGPGGRA